MALANIACLFGKTVSEKDRVLVIDWDLEAPGLHYYLTPQDQDNSSGLTAGVVELFTAIQDIIFNQKEPLGIADPQAIDDIFDRVDLSKFIVNTRAENVYLLPAGVLDETYQSRLAKLQWEGMYNICPALYNSFALYLRKQYCAVFVDSRT
jgi:MinD-like ATPase involved in chromosome partitioning or flagellar assembly